MQENSEISVSISVIFTELPDHVALLCLARLPARARAAGSCVSRAWRSALSPSSIWPVRLALKIPSNDLIFVAIKQQDAAASPYTWRPLVVYPGRRAISFVPQPENAPAVDWNNLQAAVSLHGKLYLIGSHTPDPSYCQNSLTILRYDGDRGVWSSIPSLAPRFRRSFASAGLGKFVYVAGGFGAGGESLATAARFDTETYEWEVLPAMKRERDTCSAFVMDGRVYVIGGYKVCESSSDDVEESSAEVFDPKTGTWTLIEGVWTESLRWRAGVDDRRQPVVAVAGNTLYAMEHCTSHLFRYDAGRNRWIYLDCVGHHCGKIRLVSGEEDFYGICACGGGGKICVLALTRGGEDFRWSNIEICDAVFKGFKCRMLGCATMCM
uniref:F-box domain-containing protein n=1 Tax=Araucaria cunninghamii TaxID=56994 RepID=A0A0D6R9H2_ARACU